MSRFQKFVRSLRFMVEPWHPPKRPTFTADERLELRQAMQRDLIGDRPLTPLIESQPDYGEPKPIDYDRGLPNG